MDLPLGLPESAPLPESEPLNDLDLSADLGSGTADCPVSGVGLWGLVAIAAVRCVLPRGPNHVTDSSLGLDQRGSLALTAVPIADSNAIHLLAQVGK